MSKIMVKGVEIPVDQIKPSPYQPRLTFDLEDIKGSIMRDGILVPLTVRKKDGYYELVDGERRWRVAKDLGYETVPCDVIDIDDDTARRMVWKVNTLRKDYEPKEKALFFKRMQEDYGMSLRGIAREYDQSPHTVKAYLNVFKLPVDYQQMVWDRVIPIGVILELEQLFNGVQYCTPENNPEIFSILDRAAKVKGFGAMQAREALKPYLAKLREEEIKKAKEVLAKVKPKVEVPETPEELEEAAKALRERAKELKTPEQILEEKREKARKALLEGKGSVLSKVEKAKRLGIDITEFKERMERIKEKIIDNPDKALKETKRLKNVIDEAIKDFEEKRKEEELRKRLEEEARVKAKEELLRDTEFVRKFIEREYTLMPETMKTEDLEKELMRRLIANIPEEKRERAKEIFREEFRSLHKRLKIFPEKSEKIAPKFEQLRLLEERGVIPYTVWDFKYRDDYAGDKDFHGNCSPQIVEQCIWRLTEEGDLVVDPMAGSGTALDVCKKFNRRCIGYDIKPPENRHDIIQNDSRKIPLEDESVDMIFIHPPYWNLTYYTKAEENLPDLSRAKTVEEYLAMLKQVFKECYRILKHGKFMCVLLGDLIRGGRFIPLCRKATNLAEEIGFIDYGYAVKLAHGEVSRKKSGVIIAEPIYTNNLKISHDLVIFLRKPEHHGN